MHWVAWVCGTICKVTKWCNEGKAPIHVYCFLLCAICETQWLFVTAFVILMQRSYKENKTIIKKWKEKGHQERTCTLCFPNLKLTEYAQNHIAIMFDSNASSVIVPLSPLCNYQSTLYIYFILFSWILIYFMTEAVSFATTMQSCYVSGWSCSLLQTYFIVLLHYTILSSHTTQLQNTHIIGWCYLYSN